MNRIFHARITWYQYLYLILLGGLSFFLLWEKLIIPAAICMVLLVVLIERFIHTTTSPGLSPALAAEDSSSTFVTTAPLFNPY